MCTLLCKSILFVISVSLLWVNLIVSCWLTRWWGGDLHVLPGPCYLQDYDWQVEGHLTSTACITSHVLQKLKQYTIVTDNRLSCFITVLGTSKHVPAKSDFKQTLYLVHILLHHFYCLHSAWLWSLGCLNFNSSQRWWCVEMVIIHSVWKHVDEAYG